jgi:hypothetical protein
MRFWSVLWGYFAFEVLEYLTYLRFRFSLKIREKELPTRVIVLVTYIN